MSDDGWKVDDGMGFFFFIAVLGRGWENWDVYEGS